MAFNFNTVQQNTTTNPFDKGDSRLSGITVPPSPVKAPTSGMSENFDHNSLFSTGFKPVNDARFVA